MMALRNPAIYLPHSIDRVLSFDQDTASQQVDKMKEDLIRNLKIQALKEDVWDLLVHDFSCECTSVEAEVLFIGYDEIVPYIKQMDFESLYASFMERKKIIDISLQKSSQL
jgi:hypothetical protein